MKKKYFVPEVEITWVRIEETILSNVEDLHVRSYGSDYNGNPNGEDTSDFWN